MQVSGMIAANYQILAVIVVNDAAKGYDDESHGHH